MNSSNSKCLIRILRIYSKFRMHFYSRLMQNLGKIGILFTFLFDCSLRSSRWERYFHASFRVWTIRSNTVLGSRCLIQQKNRHSIVSYFTTHIYMLFICCRRSKRNCILFRREPYVQLALVKWYAHGARRCAVFGTNTALIRRAKPTKIRVSLGFFKEEPVRKDY